MTPTKHRRAQICEFHFYNGELILQRDDKDKAAGSCPNEWCNSSGAS
jgi:hypothetical protein